MSEASRAIVANAPIMIVAALVIFRLGWLVVNDEGPFEVFEKLRMRFEIYKRDTWIRRGFNCVLCVTFWPSLAIGFVLAWNEGSSALVGLAYGLAISGLVVVFAKQGN